MPESRYFSLYFFKKMWDGERRNPGCARKGEDGKQNRTFTVVVNRSFVEPPAQHESTSPNVCLLALVPANFSLEKLKPSRSPQKSQNRKPSQILAKMAAGSAAKCPRPVTLKRPRGMVTALSPACQSLTCSHLQRCQLPTFLQPFSEI